MAQLLWVLQAALASSLEKQMVPCRAVKSSPVTVQGIRRGRVINWSSRVARQAEKRRGPSQALSGHPLGKAHRGIGGPSSNAARQRAHSNTNSLLFLGFFLCSMFLPSFRILPRLLHSPARRPGETKQAQSTSAFFLFNFSSQTLT